jgi:hypothetical protein
MNFLKPTTTTPTTGLGTGFGGGTGTSNPTTFGSTSFGTGTTFGQVQGQQTTNQNVLGGQSTGLGGLTGSVQPQKPMFGSTTTTTSTGLGGGLFNTATKPATSTLGTGNLLGNTSQTQTSNFTFGGTKPTTGVGFGSTQTSQTGSFGFGQTQQTGGLSSGLGFGQTQQTTQLNPFGQQIQPSITNQNNNKKELDKQEILQVIQNYMSCLNPKTNVNAFKYMLYNRVPKGYEQYIQAFQQYKQVEKIEDGTENLVDFNYWMKALQNNPNPNLFYPYQVSSPSQLVQRVKTTEILEFTALETIMNLQNNLNILNNTYDIEIDNEVSTIKNKLQMIKAKQLSVMSKIEKLALITGKAEKKFNLETSISNKLNTLKSVLSENRDYAPKIKELQTMTTLMGFENQQNEEKDYFKDLDKERLEKNVNVLRDMKKIFDVTFSSLKENISVVNFIKNDLDNLQRYGKLPK